MKRIWFIMMPFLFFAGTSVWAQTATVRTDLDDYPPGSTAIITGTGFQPGEYVELHVHHAEGDSLGTDPQNHEPWYVTADADGNFTTSWYVPTEEEGDALGATFILEAHGNMGSEAEWTFTDATRTDTYPSAFTSISGGATYCLNNPASNLSASWSNTSCEGTASGGNTNLDITIKWYKNSTNSTVGGTVVQTSPANTKANTTSSTYLPSTSTSGTSYYYVVITWSAGANCAPTGSITSTIQTVIVNSVPTAPTITAGSSTTFCSGGSVVLTSSASAGNQWYQNGVLIVGATNQTYSATASGSYTVVVTNNGCSSPPSNATVVTVNPLPTASIDDNSQNQTGICFGGSPVLQLTGSDNARVYYTINSGTELSTVLKNGGQGSITISSINVNTTALLTRVTLNGCESALSEAGTITLENTPPTLTPGADVTSTTSADGTGDCSVAIAIADLVYEDNCNIVGPTLSWTMTGATTGSGSGQVGTKTFNTGITTIKYTVTDAVGLTATDDVTVTVNDDELPTITCPGDISTLATSAAGAFVTYTAPVGSDNCPDAITTLIDGPASGSIFPIGITTVKYQVEDASGNKTVCSFTVEIKGLAPVIGCPVNISVSAGSGVCGANVSFAATETTGIPRSTITYSIAPSSFFPVGTTTVTATATNPIGTSSCSFSVTVTDDEKPTVTAPTTEESYTADAGVCSASLSFGASADDNCEVESIEYSVGGESISFPYAFPVGTTQVDVLVTDIHDNTNSTSFDVVVTDDEAPTVTAPTTEDSYTADAGVCSASLSFGVSADDNCDVESTEYSVGGVSISFPYAFPVGTTKVDVLVTDIHSNTNSTSFEVVVTDDEKPTVTAPTTEDSYTADAGVCSASLSFGVSADDNCEVESIAYSVGGESISFPYAFPVGTTTVDVLVMDIHDNTNSTSFDVVVTDDEAPVITSNGNQNVYTDAGVCGATVEVSAGATDNCSVGEVSGVRSDGLPLDALYPVGPTTIKWNVTDANGNPAVEVEQIVVVNNDVPEITSISAPIDPVQVNTNVTLSVGYSDNDASNINVKWGDNTESNHLPNSTITHAYTAAGVYTVTVRVYDWCGESDTETYQYIVIFDPNGGFVTGGGWIKSPIGALVANPSLEGRANFGFVSKYKKGSTSVEGNTEFQFQTGSINFKSSSHIAGSLVITDAKAIYKGVGTINGAGNYGFMVSAIDGQITGGGGYDRFRIKIWDKGNGDALVYDNQSGGEYDALTTDGTKLQGGSIVIHTSKSSKRDGVEEEVATNPQEIPETSLSVYPNPVEEVIHVNFTSDSNTPVGMQLIDLQGRSMKMETYPANPEGVYEMSVSHLNMNAGFYLLRIAQDKASKTIKLYKK